MNKNFRGRIYPSGSSNGFAVNVAVDGTGELVATDGQNSARWKVDELALKLGGCAEDRVVISCPSGDTIISTDFNMLDALSGMGPAVDKQIRKTKQQKNSAAWRRRLGVVAIPMLWYGFPLMFIGGVILLMVIGIAFSDHSSTSTSDSSDTEQTQTATSTDEDGTAAIDERYGEFILPHLKSAWHPPTKMKKPFKTVAGFVVAADGSLGEMAVTRSSGNQKFDSLVESTIHKAEPYPKPPKDGGVSVYFEFSTTGVKTAKPE